MASFFFAECTEMNSCGISDSQKADDEKKRGEKIQNEGERTAAIPGERRSISGRPTKAT